MVGEQTFMESSDIGPPDAAANPCITCGACCAYYRASFYWGETDASRGGTVPAGMTEKLNDFRAVMRGTNQPIPRCIALLGQIGQSVGCSIYELRASVCRDFKVSWEDGLRNERCDKARAAWGLPPLEPPVTMPAGEPENPDDIDPPWRPTVPRAA
jgi:Fe-S-cluster containining protein